MEVNRKDLNAIIGKLYTSFIWKESKEGEAYWIKVVEKLNHYAMEDDETACVVERDETPRTFSSGATRGPEEGKHDY